MADLCIRLFGRFSVTYDEHPLGGLESRKVQELFSHLVLYHQVTHHREVLATLLWPDNPAVQARKSLRHTLWQLQTFLEQVPTVGSSLLRVDPEWVQFHLSADVWVDALAFEHAHRQTHGISDKQLTPESVAQLCYATDLYESDLLNGRYQDWCIYERERFQGMYLDMLDKLLRYRKASGAYEDAIDVGRRMLRFNHSHEPAHRQLMQLHYLADNRAEALRQFKRCVAALQDDLGVEPSQRTIALYEQIRDERPLDGFSSTPANQELDLPLPELLGDLKQLGEMLILTQQLLRQHIQFVERALHLKDEG